MTIERSITLDYLKIVLSILVITIHIPFSGFYQYQCDINKTGDVLGWLISNGISRIAVPVFFIINIYFLEISNSEKVKRYLKKLSIIYIVWSLVYLVWIYEKNLDIVGIFKIIIFGKLHLWYLPALIEGVAMYYFLKKLIQNKKTLLSISILLFISGYILQNIYYNQYESWHLMKFRNSLFIALPFIIIGDTLKTLKFDKYKTKSFYVLIIGIFILLIESYLSLKYVRGSEFYISLLLVCPCLFIYCLSIPHYKISDSYISDLSSGIYFIHPLIITFVIAYLKDFSNLLLFALVVFLSIHFAHVIIGVNKRIRVFL